MSDILHVAATSPIQALQAAIAAGASVSATIVLPGYSNPIEKQYNTSAMVSIITPANWTTAPLTIEVSPDGGVTWIAQVFDDLGNQSNLIASAAASTAYTLSPTGMLPYNTVRFRSGSTASPVAQTNAVSLTYITRPLA